MSVEDTNKSKNCFEVFKYIQKNPINNVLVFFSFKFVLICLIPSDQYRLTGH